MVKKCVVTFLREPLRFLVRGSAKGYALFYYRGYAMGISKTCCFFGHRKINKTDKLKDKVYEVVENLITQQKVDRFLFGSKSEFDKLCLSVVTELKEKYPHIRRVYVRAEYPYINDDYRAYLLQSYEDTYYPERAVGAGKAVYVVRNYEMIDNSGFCVVYYDENYIPAKRKNNCRDLTDSPRSSGTKIAYEYAKSKQKNIIKLKNA